MDCYICSLKTERVNLCKEHALELKKMLDEKVTVIENPDWKHHCHICGEHEGRIIVEYQKYGYFCDTDINEAFESYSK